MKYLLSWDRISIVVDKMILLQSMPPEYSIEKDKEYDDMISCTIVVSVSASLLWQPLDTKSNDYTTSKSLKADI